MIPKRRDSGNKSNNRSVNKRRSVLGRHEVIILSSSSDLDEDDGSDDLLNNVSRFQVPGEEEKGFREQKLFKHL